MWEVNIYMVVWECDKTYESWPHFLMKHLVVQKLDKFFGSFGLSHIQCFKKW